MTKKLASTGILSVILVSAAVMAAVACGAAEEPAAPLPAAAAAPAAAAPAIDYTTEVTTAAPQAQQAPAAAAPARAPAQPAAPQAPAGTGARSTVGGGATGVDPTAATAAFKYVAPVVAPGDYPDHNWDGPVPTKFNESPMSAALVKAGTLPPVEERLPIPEDVWVLAPYDEIGQYGGTMRITSSQLKTLDHLATTSLVNGDPRGNSEPRIIKAYEVSDDGRKYTFTNRRGAHWSDGYPWTMEDVRFAMEDLMFNAGDVNPASRIPGELKSQITGNVAKFNVVDDVTWTVTFDDPYYDLASSRHMWGSSKTRGCPKCYYAPAHIYKRYHVDYNPEENAALMEKYGVDSPKNLFNKIKNVRSGPGLDWRQTGPQPSVADPNYIYKGEPYAAAMSELLQTHCCEGGRGATRNHFFIGVDPEGNQLPYMDGQELIKVENRDVGVFRAMNGENDYFGGDMVLSEMPLYISNMDKGDYSVMIFRSPAGTDSATVINQEYIEDPEIGALMRTKDFRKALSLGIDRDILNEVVASGIGTPQQWVPHPSTPYYPGADYANLDTTQDIPAAKALLAKMGYSDADGDGWLDRKDGTGPLKIKFYTNNRLTWPHVQIMASHWEKLGIKWDLDYSSTSKKMNIANPTLYLDQHYSLYSMNQWTVTWTRAFAGTGGAPVGAAMGGYFQSFGEGGMAPTGGDAAYTDAYGTQASANNYPADISGNVKEMQDIWRTGIQTGATYDPKRVEMGKKWWRIGAEEKYNIGALAYMGIFRGMTKKRNNVRNVPKNHVALEGKGVLGLYYFEDGLDNMTNPGNRSKKYKSVHFLDPEYWTN